MMGSCVNSKASTKLMLKNIDASVAIVERLCTGTAWGLNMNKAELKLYNNLRREKVKVQKHNQVRLNAGSETIKHCVAKVIVARIAADNEWRVSSEVTVPEGEIDILLHQTSQERVWAIELETSPTTEVRRSKLERYVKNQPEIDDIAIINISNLPVELPYAEQYIREELPIC